eukprot:5812538-Amphidinium_carterae.2
MENGFGQSIIQVDNEPAIIQLAQKQRENLQYPGGNHCPVHIRDKGRRRDSIRHCSHKCEQYASTLLNLQTPDNAPEALLPWVLQHACFTINRYLVHTDGMTNYQRRWEVQHNSAICSFGEVVSAKSKPITVNKLDIRNKEQNTEGIWLEKTTNIGEHIIATMDESGKVFHTWSLTRLTPELERDRKVFDKIVIPQLDTSMNKDYVEEEHIGKTIIDEFFTKTRLNEK